MKADPILEEVWRIKEEVSAEMAADPKRYFARLEEMEEAEEKAGRKVIRSAAELRQFGNGDPVTSGRSSAQRNP